MSCEYELYRIDYILLKDQGRFRVVKNEHILKPSSDRSPYIFTLVQKVKHGVYKSHAFLNEAILFQDSTSYFI